MSKINFSILDEIVAVANILEKSGFSEGRLKLAKPHIKKLEKAIPADGKALLYFCAMFRMCMSAKLNYFGTPRQERNLHNLGKFLEVDECYLLRDYDIFDELLKKELLCKNDFHQTDLFSYMNENFFIAEAVYIPIIKNEKIEEHIKTEREAQLELYSLFRTLHGKSIITYIDTLIQFERKNSNYNFIQRPKSVITNTFERVIFFHLIFERAVNCHENNMKKLLFDFFADWTEISEFLKDKKCELKTKGIIEVTSAEFTDDYEINLTGFGLWCFYGEDACYYDVRKPSLAKLK